MVVLSGEVSGFVRICSLPARLRWVLAACLAWVLVATPASAEEPLHDPLARELKLAGDTAMGALRYQDALDAYERATAIEAHPSLLFNRARALQALHRYPEALDHFEDPIIVSRRNGVWPVSNSNRTMPKAQMSATSLAQKTGPSTMRVRLGRVHHFDREAPSEVDLLRFVDGPTGGSQSWWGLTYQTSMARNARRAPLALKPRDGSPLCDEGVGSKRDSPLKHCALRAWSCGDPSEGCQGLLNGA